MTRLIGFRWTHGNMWSREVLIVRGLTINFPGSGHTKGWSDAAGGSPPATGRFISRLQHRLLLHHHDSVTMITTLTT